MQYNKIKKKEMKGERDKFIDNRGETSLYRRKKEKRKLKKIKKKREREKGKKRKKRKNGK